VSKALAHKLTGDERRALGKRFTESPLAYQAYLKGRYFLEKRTTEGCKKGIDYFKRAIAIDSKYALAYAGIAACHITLNTVLPSREWNQKAESAALSALELDETLAEAHASLGLLRTRQWNWSAGERELKISIQLKPTYATARASYAIHLVETGRFDEGIAEIKRAQALEPLSLLINSQLGSLLYLSRFYYEALEQFRKTLELDANFAVARFSLGNLLEVLGRYEDAAREYQVSQVGLGNLPEYTACMARIHAFSGRRAKALRSIATLRSLSKSCYVQSNLIALIYTALGQKDDAFDWLERAYAERDEDLCLLKIDPRLDSLRTDPRFISLLERVGLNGSDAVTSSE
jgi:tetratricopeptide (TPR) repeat protein